MYTLTNIVHLNSVTAEMIDTVRQFLDGSKGWLYLWGGPGNGKTLALMAAVNEFVARGVPALYITLADLLDVMRETFKYKAGVTVKEIGEDAWNEWGTYQQRFRRLREIGLLAVDEFDAGKVNMTPFAAEFRTRLIDHRYRDALGQKTVTIFAGNESPEALPRWIRDRARDGRFIIFHNTAASVRPEMEW